MSVLNDNESRDNKIIAIFFFIVFLFLGIIAALNAEQYVYPIFK